MNAIGCLLGPELDGDGYPEVFVAVARYSIIGGGDGKYGTVKDVLAVDALSRARERPLWSRRLPGSGSDVARLQWWGTGPDGRLQLVVPGERPGVLKPSPGETFILTAGSGLVTHVIPNVVRVRVVQDPGEGQPLLIWNPQDDLGWADTVWDPEAGLHAPVAARATPVEAWRRLERCRPLENPFGETVLYQASAQGTIYLDRQGRLVNYIRDDNSWIFHRRSPGLFDGPRVNLPDSPDKRFPAYIQVDDDRGGLTRWAGGIASGRQWSWKAPSSDGREHWKPEVLTEPVLLRSAGVVRVCVTVRTGPGPDDQAPAEFVQFSLDQGEVQGRMPISGGWPVHLHAADLTGDGVDDLCYVQRNNVVVRRFGSDPPRWEWPSPTPAYWIASTPRGAVRPATLLVWTNDGMYGLDGRDQGHVLWYQPGAKYALPGPTADDPPLLLSYTQAGNTVCHFALPPPPQVGTAAIVPSDEDPRWRWSLPGVAQDSILRCRPGEWGPLWLLLWPAAFLLWGSFQSRVRLLAVAQVLAFAGAVLLSGVLLVGPLLMAWESGSLLPLERYYWFGFYVLWVYVSVPVTAVAALVLWPRQLVDPVLQGFGRVSRRALLAMAQAVRSWLDRRWKSASPGGS